MNPFVAFLIIVLLLLSLVFTLAAAGLIIRDGPSGGTIAAFVVMLSISGALVYLLKRTSRSPYLEFQGSEQGDESAKRFFTTFIVFIVYTVLFILAFVLFNYDSIRNWPGAFLVMISLFLCYSGISDLIKKDTPQLGLPRESMVQQRERLEILCSSFRSLRNRLSILLLPIVVLSVVSYRLLDDARYVSLFDLAGFLFLVGAFCFWTASTEVSSRRKLQAFRKRLEDSTG